MHVYLARQPIFDRRQKVVAYELLYRAGKANFNPQEDGTRATMEVVSNTLCNIGFGQVSRGKRLFINFNNELLNDHLVYLLPKEAVVIEITEDTVADQQTIETCKKLKEEGYTLALDDFCLDTSCAGLLQFADIIKLDFRVGDPSELRKTERYLKGRAVKILAEKIESEAECAEALGIGYDFFQGYFFCKPRIISGHAVSSTKIQSLRLLQEISKPDLDILQVELIIKQDPGLSYKLLKFINSPAFALRFEISSIRQAIALLGQKEMLKWVSLIALRDASHDKPDELIITALTRAKFCESLALATRFKDKGADLYLTGLFSLLDSFLDQPMAEILDSLPLTDEIKDALLGKKGGYRSILELVLCYEKGEWDKAYELAASEFDLDETFATSCYLKSTAVADAFNNLTS